MEIISLKSGSRGNAALIFTERTKILVDCGITGKSLTTALNSIDVSPEELDGIVITHEHRDHISGLGVVMRRYNIPLYSNKKTFEKASCLIGAVDDKDVNIIENEKDFEIGDIGIKAFSIPHDAIDPVGYSFFNSDTKISVATDIGELKKDLFTALCNSKTVLLESNHDVNMLEIGSYPLHLKQRIRGKLGHLSNDEAGKAAEYLVKLGAENIILGHLSPENNYPDLAYKTVELALKEADIKVGNDVNLFVSNGTDILKIR